MEVKLFTYFTEFVHTYMYMYQYDVNIKVLPIGPFSFFYKMFSLFFWGVGWHIFFLGTIFSADSFPLYFITIRQSVHI